MNRWMLCALRGTFCYLVIVLAGCSTSESPELIKARAAADAANAKAEQAQATVEAAHASTGQVKTELAKARKDADDTKAKLGKAQDDLAKLEGRLSQVRKQIARSNVIRTEQGKARFDKTRADMTKVGATFDGQWQNGGNADGLHVRSIIISKNDFPSAGTVKLQLGRGSIMNLPVTWQQMDGILVGLFGEGEPEEIAWINWADGALAGKVSSPVAIGSEPRDLSFSQFKKKQDK